MELEVQKRGVRMTTSIARQSVIIKCNIQKAFILGNYEYYYAAGLINKFYGVEISEDIQPEELAALLQKELSKVYSCVLASFL